MGPATGVAAARRRPPLRVPPDSAGPSWARWRRHLGEILQFEVRGRGCSAMDLRTLLEWEIAPRLREVQGVTEINAHGGFYKSFEIRPNPGPAQQLQPFAGRCLPPIEGNNETAGGGYVVHNGEQRFIRGIALLKGVEDIEAIVAAPRSRRDADPRSATSPPSPRPRSPDKGPSPATAAEKSSSAW